MKNKKLLFVLLITTLVSCKKTEINTYVKHSKFEEFFSRTTLESNPTRAAVAQLVLQNLDLSLEMNYKKGNTEISVIPINSGFKNDNNSNKKVFNFFIHVKDVKKNIDYGHIYQYHKSLIVENKGKAQNELIKLLNEKEQIFNGKITVLDITDVYLYDMQLNNSKVENIKYLKQEKKETARTGCTDWYWVLYNVNTGAIISQTYLYTTCSCEQTRTNPENEKSTYSERCSSGGGGGQNYSIEDLQNNLAILTSGGYQSETKNFNWHLYGTNGSYSNIDLEFGCGKSTYWAIMGLARFSSTINNGNINLTLYSVSVNFTTSFPGPFASVYEGVYTPTNSPIDVIHNNNSTNPYTNIVRNGFFKVQCKLPGLSWINEGGSVTGNLNFSAIKH